jgi:pimeloyl-ACP methyl ester carboxylesterase
MTKLGCLVALLGLLGCGDDNAKTPDGGSDAAFDAAPQSPIALALPCSDSVNAVYTVPSGLPTYDASHRGDVIRCASDRALSTDQIGARLTQLQFVMPQARSSTNVYRIAYRTDRLLGHEGVSTALVFLPDQPIAAGSPLVVAAHGTVGAAAPCVPSHVDLTGTADNEEIGMFLTLAGYGYVVVAPDYAGYASGSTPGWLLAEDEAHSLLDATRAMQKLLSPGQLSDKVVLVGHSQGGHAVLAAQALASQYGLSGSIAGVVPMAPVWFVGKTWGAAISPIAGQNTTDNPGVVGYATLYFYSHGEVYDGAGGGLTMFQASKRPQVQQLMTTQCTGGIQSMIAQLGATPSDFFDMAFVTSLGNCAVFESGCDAEPAATWVPRFRADRPPIDAHSAPIVVWQGAMDQTVTPGRAQCGFDKIQADLAAATAPTTTFQVCGDAMADHPGVVRRNIYWVSQWIAARTLGQTEPAACPGTAPLQPQGGQLTCATPPSNVD